MSFLSIFLSFNTHYHSLHAKWSSSYFNVSSSHWLGLIHPVVGSFSHVSISGDDEDDNEMENFIESLVLGFILPLSIAIIHHLPGYTDNFKSDVGEVRRKDPTNQQMENFLCCTMPLVVVAVVIYFRLLRLRALRQQQQIPTVCSKRAKSFLYSPFGCHLHLIQTLESSENTLA